LVLFGHWVTEFDTSGSATRMVLGQKAGFLPSLIVEEPERSPPEP
jgi:hypothetical protein